MFEPTQFILSLIVICLCVAGSNAEPGEEYLKRLAENHKEFSKGGYDLVKRFTDPIIEAALESDRCKSLSDSEHPLLDCMKATNFMEIWSLNYVESALISMKINAELYNHPLKKALLKPEIEGGKTVFEKAEKEKAFKVIDEQTHRDFYMDWFRFDMCIKLQVFNSDYMLKEILRKLAEN